MARAKLRRNPLVYHGTPYAFPMGEARVQEGHYGPGIYFTSSRQQAIDYATRPGLGGHEEVFVQECQVDLKNPIYFHEIFSTHIGPAADRFLAQLPQDKQELHHILERSIDRRAPPARTIQQLQERGYDGVIVDFTKFGWPRENVQFYVVFDPKSLVCTRERHYKSGRLLANATKRGKGKQANPLKRGCSPAARSANIRELISTGRPAKQAVAIAYAEQRREGCKVPRRKRRSPSKLKPNLLGSLALASLILPGGLVALALWRAFKN